MAKSTTDDQDNEFVKNINRAAWLITYGKPTKKVNWMIGIAAEILLKDYVPQNHKTASSGQDSFSCYVGLKKI